MIKNKYTGVFLSGANAATLVAFGMYYRNFQRSRRQINDWAEKLKEQAEAEIDAATNEAVESAQKSSDFATNLIQQNAEEAKQQMVQLSERYEQALAQMAKLREESEVLSSFHSESLLVVIEVRRGDIDEESAISIVTQLYEQVIAKVDSEGPHGHRLLEAEIHLGRIKRLLGMDED